MDGNVISGWCISQKQGEEEGIEGYLKAWDAIKELDIGPSHVNLAAEIANRFMSGGHYANMVHFVNNLDESFLQNMKGNEKFARSLIALRMTQRKYSEVFTLLEDGRFTNKEGLLEMWDEAHYREWEERMGKPLNALLRYRIRQRFLPPQHICPNGTRPTTRLPDQALKILKEWLMQHPNDPYPSKIDKDLLMKKSGLSLSQVKTWFANARRRLRLKKEKRDKGGALDGEGMTCSEHDGSSDSPEDLFSGEDIVLKDEDDGGNVSGLGGEPNRDHESSHDGGFVSYARNNNRYNSLSSEQPQNLVCGTLEQNGIPKSEKWPEPIIQSVYPPNTAANHMPLFQTGRMSTSYIPCHQATQTSEYLKAMAGMCEEITPSTYQLGAPRPPKHTLCHTLSDLQSMQHSRTATCSVVQDDSYRCVSYQKQSQQPDHGSLYSSLRGSPCLGDAFTQRQKKWYQGHESSLIRSYSMSAPPSLMPLTTVTSHQPFQHPTNSLMSGMLRDQLQDPSWSAYQTTFNERCFMCCSGQCSGSHPASSLHPNDNTNVPLPSFGRPIVGSNAGLPMMHHEPPVTTMQQMTTQSSQPDQGFRQWTPVKRLTNDQQRGPLPAFHTSFDILKLPIPPLPLSHHLYEQGQTDNSPKNVIGHGYPSLRPPEVPNQTNQAILSSLRRRHRSQPAIASEPLEAPVYLRTSTSPTTGISKSLSNTPELVKPDFTRPFRKRSASIAESEAKNIKYVKHSSHQPIVPAECSKVFTKAPIQGSIPNGQPAHVKHVDAATNQMSPPHAHVHQKPKPSIPVDAEEPLCSTSLDPSLSTHTQANPTESREGMKEIAQVLLDLSTKGSKTDS